MLTDVRKWFGNLKIFNGLCRLIFVLTFCLGFLMLLSQVSINFNTTLSIKKHNAGIIETAARTADNLGGLALKIKNFNPFTK